MPTSDPMIGMRGPFGTSWGLDVGDGRDLVIVAGGVGLAPLRPVVLAALGARDRFGRVTLIAGARSRDDFLFRGELDEWARAGVIDVHLTVDVPVQGWPGEVGFVTEPLRRLTLRPDNTTAYLCGPEVMMRNGARELTKRVWRQATFACRWNETCSAGSGGADTASSVRCCCAATDRSSATTSPSRCLW